MTGDCVSAGHVAAACGAVHRLNGGVADVAEACMLSEVREASSVGDVTDDCLSWAKDAAAGGTSRDNGLRERAGEVGGEVAGTIEGAGEGDCTRSSGETAPVPR